MAKAIMILGTMSNVGKSLIAGGLCRIFSQAGYKTAPFKSQNMALNSYITADGLEMGRAQVMQAEAAGIEPDVHMNPILLKPTTDVGSQVILNGRPIGNMAAAEYYKNKTAFVPSIMESYNYLNERYDIIVIEGAGSPAEINLKQNDIVNMGMAKLANAPALLVGDIDRGGVFAQLLGTVDLLDYDEKQYIKGLVINKFRGDKSILLPGLDMLEERSQKPVLGVVPYIHCDIDDEDSLSEKFSKKQNRGLCDIAVVRLPKISNFTDFNVFECVEGVSLRYAANPSQLDGADIIIIPGTKNTISDMLWMRQNGIEAKIKQHAAAEKPVIGICGGYQMLGGEITDENSSEGGGSCRGMCLLPAKTIFKPHKTTTRINGKIEYAEGIFSALKGKSFDGYEIHMGSTSADRSDFRNMNILTDISTKEEKHDGCCKGNVYGTYVHGFFDSADIVQTIVNAVLDKKGIAHTAAVDMHAYKQRQYDILADAIENNMDMESIYKILWEGIQYD